MDDIYAPRDLGDGLVLRWSTPEDVDRIGTLGATVFRQSATAPLNKAELLWTRDLASGRHPLAQPNGGLLVEDTRAKTIAASLWTLRAPWRYGDIPFEIGRPEEVITDPAYRNRGLVRAMFGRFHEWSERQGHLAQAITGISYFYRQFGYEYAIELGGGHLVMFGDIPVAPADEAEPFTLREAVADDLPWLQQLYEQARRTSLVSSDVPLHYWQWMFDGIDHAGNQGWRTVVVIDQAGTPHGAFVLHSVRWGTDLMIHQVLWEAERNLVPAIKPVLRALRAYAPSVPPLREPKDADRIYFEAGKGHFFDALNATVTTTPQPAYAWYVRVSDLPRFLATIAPVLEQRVRGSGVAGFDGELRLDFFRGGLVMRWQQGRLTAVDPWQRVEWGAKAHGQFPPHVFLQALFGRRSLDDLFYAFPDVSVDRDYLLLMRTLFPAKPSHVLVLN